MKNTNTMNMTKTEMKKVLIIVALVLGFGILSSAHAASGRGTTGAQFLRVGVGARASAMAGAFSPVADDATALYWNPAGLSQLEKRDAELSYNAYFKDSAAQYAGYAHPTSIGTFAGSINMFSVKNIESRSLVDTSDTPDGTFKTQDLAASFGWASKTDLGGGDFHYGAGIKYVSSDLNTATGKTGAIDLGTLYNIGEKKFWTVSMAVLNIGGKMKFNNEADALPLDVKPGIAIKPDLGRMGKLVVALDGDYYTSEGAGNAQLGFEWWPVSAFALRAGYQSGRNTNAGSGAAVGAGFRVVGLSIDYAFVPYGDLGDTHRVSLGYKF